MGIRLKLKNPDLSKEERTYLEADYTSGTSLTVRNNEGFAANEFVIVGEPGQEQTEAGKVSSTTGNATITLAATLVFSHTKSIPIYKSEWDKIDLHRASSSGGSFTAVSGSPFSIEWDESDLTTVVDDASGSSTDYYKYRFYNSATATYSAFSGEIPAAGLARTQVGYLIKQVKRSPITKEVDNDTIIEFFNDWQDVVYEEIPTAWWFSKEGTAVATAADTYKYSIEDNWDDFRSMDVMLYNYVSGSTSFTYPLSWSPPAEFYNYKMDSSQSSDDNAKFWTLLPPDSSSDKGYIALHPTPENTTCYLKPVYFFELTDLDSFDDTVIVPKPKGYVDYALYRICDEIKMDGENADKFFARVRGSITALKKHNRRQLGQKEFTRFRGHKGWSRMFGEQSHISTTDARENYW